MTYIWVSLQVHRLLIDRGCHHCVLPNGEIDALTHASIQFISACGMTSLTHVCQPNSSYCYCLWHWQLDWL